MQALSAEIGDVGLVKNIVYGVEMGNDVWGQVCLGGYYQLEP